ncbi:30S ribosomal protein S5 [Patescibacteria group bacterium]|nr:30S ribosomal protein S5 [Patescibacteria group bacterium]
MADRRRKFRRKPKSEFDQKLVDIRRVTRVVAGGRRMRFRVTIVLGDKKRRVGAGTAKGNDVSSAIEKAIKQAKKNMVTVPVTENGTIPHEVMVEEGSARLFLKPAFPGTGIIAGGSVRSVLELAGVRNVFSKIYGTNNKLNNVNATVKALSEMRSKEKVFKLRGKEFKEKTDASVKEEVKKVPEEEKKQVLKKPSTVEKKPAVQGSVLDSEVAQTRGEEPAPKAKDKQK